MRKTSELKFNPVQFALCGTNGSPGTKGSNKTLLRSALSQNILYSTWQGAKTVNEIADALGVSPVYVESEAEYLAEYGFLLESKGRYRCNILIDEASDALTELSDSMYKKAASLFANELYDELLRSGILQDERIVCGQKEDENFLLWALIPYIAALSGESLLDKSIAFEQAATIRPDGGHNVCYATLLAPDARQPMYFESIRRWSGPCWNRKKEHTLWLIDSEWSANRARDGYIARADRVLSLFRRAQSEALDTEDYAFLAELGVIKTSGAQDGLFKAAWQLVWLRNAEIKRELLAIGDRIKAQHWAVLEALKAPFIQATLDATPKHLHTMQKYGLQYIFFSDGCFLLHCLKELVGNGKLKRPSEEQRKALMAVIVCNKGLKPSPSRRSL